MCGNNRTNRACSSHRISDKLLEESVFLSLKQHIDNIADMGRILAYLETLPYHQAEVEKADIQRIKRQEEAERYRRLKSSLYESLAEGLIDKAEYLEMKAIYDAKLQDVLAAEAKMKEEMEGLLKNHSANTFWIERFKQHQNLEKLTRHIAVTLIERIEVHEDCRIMIRFKYQYSYEQALALVRGMEKAAQPDFTELQQQPNIPVFPDGQKQLNGQKKKEAV